MHKPILLGKAQLEAVRFASDDPGQPMLHGIHVSPDGAVDATNGHCCVHVPPAPADASKFPQPAKDWTAPELPAEGAILPPRLVLDALKSLPKGRTAARFPLLAHALLAECNGRVDLVTTDLDSTAHHAGNPIEGPFPNVEQVYPKGEVAYRIAFDPELLRDCLDALLRMGVSRESNGVTLTFYANNQGAMRFDAVNADGLPIKGLVMPLSRKSIILPDGEQWQLPSKETEAK